MEQGYNLRATRAWIYLSGKDHRLVRTKVLAWQVLKHHRCYFLRDCLTDALNEYDAPEIFNAAQGSPFTSTNWIDVLQEHGCKISMDDRGRALDNIFIERLWRSVK